MSTWYVRMTFAGKIEGETSFDALAELKRRLGVLPEDDRPGITVTDCSARLLTERTEPDEP